MIVSAPVFMSDIPCSTDLLIFQQNTKKATRQLTKHSWVRCLPLASTSNQEGITYDDNDDDVHNIGMMDIYKK
jgi:hypothetical protein